MPYVEPTTYTVYPEAYSRLPESQRHFWTLYVVRVDRERDRWAVRWTNVVSGPYLDKHGKLVHGLPKKSETVFTLDRAMRLASEAVETYPFQGMTAREAAEWYAARKAD